MNPVLLDAGPIVALLNRSDSNHRRCAEAMKAPGVTLVTCEAVITEACHILRHVSGAAKDILTNVRAGRFQLPFRLQDRTAEVIALVAKYADTPMSLADASLVDMASVLTTARVLTLDSDFRIYRWGRNRPFELLLDA